MTNEITRPDADGTWTELAARAVLSALVPGLGRYEPAGGGIRSLDDAGNGWWGMTRIEGGRAVVYGHDVDYSRTRHQVLPIDLLAGGPAWLPWERLVELIREEQILAFVHWWDGESWGRTAYPDGMDDGFGDELRGYFQFHENFMEHAADERAAQAAYDAVLAAARARTVDRDVLEALIRALDPEAVAGTASFFDADAGFALEGALAVAEWAGVAPGSRWPEVPAGNGEPAERRVFAQHEGWQSDLVGRAMCLAEEAERPVPAEGEALRAVAAWMRENGHAEIRAALAGRWNGRFTLRDRDGTEWKDPAFGELLDAWREEEGDDRSGRWLFVRVRVRDGEVTAERAYDHRPPFWTGFAVARRKTMDFHEPREPIDVLREEMERRDPGWRPGWESRLAPDHFITEGIPPELCWRPGLEP
ncbi:hypothetical protein [Spirillospora sp. NPDC029432]|uniref:hypothetical protein n=1 Tax=Spirillospora sp. NPDC029432 TaxID=3154599 RepID=UPI00345262E9